MEQTNEIQDKEQTDDIQDYVHDYVHDVLYANIGGNSDPYGRYTITAEGRMQKGWSHPVLIARVGVTIDGNLDYDFYARKSDAEVPNQLVDIKAQTLIGGPGTDLTGLRKIRIFFNRDQSYNIRINVPLE